MMHVEDSYRTLLADARLTSVDAVMGLDGGTLVGGHPRRNVMRLALTGSDGPVTLYLKRDWRRSPEEWLGAILRGRRPHSRSYHEWRMLHAVRDAGFTCPEPVAVGERRCCGMPGEAFLVVRALDGVQPLNGFLRTLSRAPAAPRRAFFAWLGAEVGRYHAAGLWHTDLYSKHVLVGGRPGAWRWAMIDLQRAGRGPTTPEWARRRDLATLDASTSPVLASRTDRLRFLRAYAESAEGVGDLKRFARRVLAESGSLLTARKVREMRASCTAEPSAREVAMLDHGCIRADAAYVRALDAAGLVTMDAMMTTRGTEFLRQLPDRANVRIELPGTAGPPVTAFLKRHVTSHVREWLCRGLSGGGLLGPGCVEAHNVHRLRSSGVPTMEVIAYGQRLRRPWRVESFVLVEQIPDAAPLDDYLRERVEPTCAGRADAALRRLIGQLADLVRRFHDAGFNHRDLYCCHVFVQPSPGGDPGLYLIDLQRVGRRRWFRRRWRVKDLAQLNDSAPGDRISRTDRMRFFRAYLQCGKLTAAHKRLARAVLAKTRRMARHVPRQGGYRL